MVRYAGEDIDKFGSEEAEAKFLKQVGYDESIDRMSRFILFSAFILSLLLRASTVTRMIFSDVSLPSSSRNFKFTFFENKKTTPKSRHAITHVGIKQTRARGRNENAAINY